MKVDWAIYAYSAMRLSRLAVVSHEAKEEYLAMNTREYFTRTNLVKLKNRFTNEP